MSAKCQKRTLKARQDAARVSNLAIGIASRGQVTVPSSSTTALKLTFQLDHRLGLANLLVRPIRHPGQSSSVCSRT